jgi:dephospho-CoA kinase
MIKIVGLTGGIGSGKSTIANFFKIIGIPVYNSDERAKWLIENNADIIQKIVNLFGNQAYINNQYNRTYVGTIVFNNPEMLKNLNLIVHPTVANDFKTWLVKQKAPYVIKEAAILFESGTYKDCHRIILITAPKELRIKRVVKRDGLTSEEVEKRINSQMSDEEKQKLSHFILINDNKELLTPKLLQLHAHLSQTGLNCFSF